MEPVIIIGGGLAGVEAAWQLLKRGVEVILFEMKPHRFSPAHKNENLAELVCSNSFRAERITAPHGLLKEEMRKLDSVVMQMAAKAKVPAGDSLAVDREEFSKLITEFLRNQKGFKLVREEVIKIPQGRIVIIASGPLTSEAFSQEILKLTGEKNLYFYDAISPIIEASSIDMKACFYASRYGKGEPDFLNCPLNQKDYDQFVEELVKAEKVETRDFEKGIYFEACLPIEVLAERDKNALAFGPMKPVGLFNPETKRRPYAIVQLRREDKAGSLFNLVGFQTKMTYQEQERIFRLIPGLKNAKFVRLGSCHRNTYLNSPRILRLTLQHKKFSNIFLAGQLIGVEGYLESAASGIIAGINVYHYLKRQRIFSPPRETAIGSLLSFIVYKRGVFQPVSFNYGLLPQLESQKVGETYRKELAFKALNSLERWLAFN